MSNSNEEDEAFLPMSQGGGEVDVGGRQVKLGNEGCIGEQRGVAQHARVLLQVQKSPKKCRKKYRTDEWIWHDRVLVTSLATQSRPRFNFGFERLSEYLRFSEYSSVLVRECFPKK